MGNAGGYHPRMADIDLTPTEEMASNAARGLELREKHGRGGTAVGVARARDIKNRKNLSPDTVRRMHSFFSRHAGNEAGGEDDAGYISFLLWGGAAGRSWAKRKSAQLDKDENAMSDTRKEIMERLGMAAHPGAKAKMGKWESTITKKDGKAIEEFTATLYGIDFKIEVKEQAGKPVATLYRWSESHGFTSMGQGNLQSMMNSAQRYAAQEAKDAGEIGRRTGMWSSRPGAKAKMAMIPIGTMRRLKKNYDEYLAYLHRNDPKRKPMSFDEFVDEHKESVKNSPMFDSNQFSRPGAKAKFGLEVGEAFEFEGKVYVVNSNADKISFLLSSLRSNSEKAMMLAAYMHKGWISYEGKRKSSRPGAKAKMARIAGNSLVLDSGDVFKITEWDDLSNAAPAIRDVISKAGVVTDKKGRMWYLRIRKNGTFVLQVPTAGGQTIQGRMESSRPGAKAKFAEDAREVAQEILRQLGGGRFMAMVGGKNAFHGTFGGKAGLQFDIGKGADGGVNRVIVKLDRGTDTYDMEFWRIGNRGMNVKKVSEASGVYADDLQRIFTSRTKFYTSLSRPGAKAKFGITNAASAFLKKMLREYASMKGTRWYDEAKYISDNPTEHTDADVIAAVGNLKLAKSVSSRPGAKVRNAIREGEKVSASDDAVSRKIRKLMDEGKPQKQAVAIALDLERRGER